MTFVQTCTPVPYVDAARQRKFAVLTINSDLPYPDHMRVQHERWSLARELEPHVVVHTVRYG